MHGIGGPEMIRVDTVEVDPPEAGEVRLRVGAIGLNRHETMVLRGEYGAIPVPAKIGYEAAGAIEAIGSGVTGFTIGDRVAILPGLHMERHGTCGELIVCPADMLVRTPADVTDIEAAATWMQFLTAFAVRAIRPLRAGDAVLITAASSSVGLAAIQLVNAAGGVSIAVTRGKSKVAALRKHGAAHVIVSDDEDVTQAALSLTDGRGVTLVFDPVGGPSFPQLLDALSHGGLAIVYGALGGEPTIFSAPQLAYRNLLVHGYAANNLVMDPDKRREALAYIGQGLANGSLRPIIDRVFNLSEIVEAYSYLEANQQIGKIVVTPGDRGRGV